MYLYFQVHVWGDGKEQPSQQQEEHAVQQDLDGDAREVGTMQASSEPHPLWLQRGGTAVQDAEPASLQTPLQSHAQPQQQFDHKQHSKLSPSRTPSFDGSSLALGRPVANTDPTSIEIIPVSGRSQ